MSYTGKYTPKQIDIAMTPEFLEKWSAEVLMGWILIDGWWTIPANPKLFSEGHLDYILSEKDWHPTSDQAPAWQIFMVIERMKDRGWYLTLNYWPDGMVHAEFSKPHGQQKVEDEFDCLSIWPLVAILTAAYAALSGKE